VRLAEAVVVPTYKRPEHLYCCLKRIREIEPKIAILVFPDRGSWKDTALIEAVLPFDADVHFVPQHDYHGNTFNAMEALKAAYNEGWQTVYYIEDDVMVHKDFFKWHREIHEEVPDLFASMAWIFNRHAPIVDDVMFQPWYYAIGTCFQRKKLELVIQHATPLYFRDMQLYIEKNFKESKLNQPAAIAHFEQDGLIQRVLDVDRSQTVSPGITKCSHLGFFGYNRGWDNDDVNIFTNCESFQERVAKLEEFIADPRWRATIFGREIVEREVGYPIPKIENTFRIHIGDYWTDFTTELAKKQLPRRIHSVTLPPNAVIEKIDALKS
jgi:hypothetical protein